MAVRLILLQGSLTEPLDQLLHFLSVHKFVAVCILQKLHGSVPRVAVIGVEGEWRWGEDATLGDAGAYCPGTRCGASQLHLLGW